MNIRAALAVMLLCSMPAQVAAAQDWEEEEPSLSVNGHLKLQTGVFVPLISDGFQPHENEAYIYRGAGSSLTRTDQTCDPVERPNRPCYAIDHGQEPGSLSMGRGTLQLEGDWTATDEVTLHAIVRGVRSMKLEADEWAQPPSPALDPAERRQFAMDWAHENYYTELEIRELYVDADAFDWLSFRVGRQQVAWGEIGQYRLLDVVNPSNETWHFGPLESFEDTRIPLWMVKGLVDLSAIEHNVELVWIPLIDDPEDTVTVPLSFVGAWGPPYSNTPSPFVIEEKVFEYPGGELKDSRAGLRWKGALGGNMTYSLVYFYTHQLSPPVPMYYDQKLLDPISGVYDSTYLDRLILQFPRQHIAGFSLEYAFESPIATVAKLEAAVEPDRTYPLRTDVSSVTGGVRLDPDIPGRFQFEPKKKLAVSYAVMLMRPTMIRFLNPTQNFLLVAQFMHTIVPTLDEKKDSMLVEIPGYNDYKVEKHSMKIVAAVRTNYFRGLLEPRLIGAYVLPDSGFYTIDLGFRLGESWRMSLAMTDFIGFDPYKGVGLFRDRDEVNLTLLCQF